MILTAHTITGVALASIVPDKPLVGFTVGFLSHFVLDAIPHWDYKLKSVVEDKNNPMNKDMIIGKEFFVDLLKIGFDAVSGLLISYLIFGLYLRYSIVVILCGAVGAMLPDALQFVYMKWKHEPFVSLQRFHLWIHGGNRFKQETLYQDIPDRI